MPLQRHTGERNSDTEKRGEGRPHKLQIAVWCGSDMIVLGTQLCVTLYACIVHIRHFVIYCSFIYMSCIISHHRLHILRRPILSPLGVCLLCLCAPRRSRWMTIARRPHPPQGKKKKVGGLAPRRFNVLSAALGSALCVEELTARMEWIHAESAARSLLFVDVVAGLIAEKIHAAVARHWLSTIASRDYVYALEKREYDAISTQHRAQLRILRANVSPEAVARMIENTREEEQLARKRVVLLEQKMFDDFFKQIGRLLLLWEPEMVASGQPDGEQHALGAGVPGPFFQEAIKRAAVEQSASPYDRTGAMSGGGTMLGRRRTRIGRDGKPLIHLCDGCPFLHAEDCPFYAATWISKESFVEQHLRRKLARLKQPIRLEQLSYDKMLQEREAHVSKMNLRMYQSTLLNQR